MCGLNVVSGSFIWFYVFFMLCGFMMFYVVLCCFMLFYDVFMWFYVVFMLFYVVSSAGFKRHCNVEQKTQS